jgi:hypothetical protein
MFPAHAKILNVNPKKRIQFPLRVQNRPGCGAVGQTIGHEGPTCRRLLVSLPMDPPFYLSSAFAQSWPCKLRQLHPYPPFCEPLEPSRGLLGPFGAGSQETVAQKSAASATLRRLRISRLFPLRRRTDQPFQSSSSSRRTAGASGFLVLEPVRRSPGLVWRPESFRHDALAAEHTGVLVDDRAVALKILVHDNTVPKRPSSFAKVRFRSSIRVRRKSLPSNSSMSKAHSSAST